MATGLSPKVCRKRLDLERMSGPYCGRRDFSQFVKQDIAQNVKSRLQVLILEVLRFRELLRLVRCSIQLQPDGSES
jgi:hypothetical protein